MEKIPYSLGNTSHLKWWVILTGIILFFVAVFLALLRVDTYLKYRALHTCGILTRQEQTLNDGNTKVTYPVQDLYKECIERVGFKQ